MRHNTIPSILYHSVAPGVTRLEALYIFSALAEPLSTKLVRRPRPRSTTHSTLWLRLHLRLRLRTRPREGLRSRFILAKGATVAAVGGVVSEGGRSVSGTALL